MTLLGQQRDRPEGDEPGSYQQLPSPAGSGAHRRAGPQRAQPGDATVGELVARLSEQVSRLVRDELALAQLEAKRRGQRAGGAAGALGLAGLLAFFGAAAFVTAAILAFSMIMRPWAAALVVGAFGFVFSGLFGTPGLWVMLRAGRGAGRESIQSVKSDVESVRAAVRR